MQIRMAGLTMLLCALLTGATTPGQAQNTNGPGGTTARAVKPYPLDHCLICGDDVGGTNRPAVFVYHGQEMKFCCQRCIKQFKANPAKYLRKLHDEEAAAAITNSVTGKNISTHS